MRLFSAQDRREKAQAEVLYHGILEASRRPAFFRDWGVADSVDGRFDMLVLHLFAFLTPLLSSNADAVRLAKRVSEAFVTDMDSNLRELGVSDVKVGRRMRTLYGAFGGRMSAYGEAVQNGPAALSAVIDRNIFPEEPNPVTSEYLSLYLVQCLETFADSPTEDVIAGRVAWPELSNKGGPASFAQDENLVGGRD